MRIVLNRWSVLALLLAVAAPAMASGPEGGGPPTIFDGSLGNAFWTLLIFAVLVLVLGKFAWGPILSNLKGREDFIRDSIEQARADREGAQKLLDDYKAQLASAREEASALVAEGRTEAEAVKSDIVRQAREEGDQMIERAKREIDSARNQAVQDVYDSAADLATDVASKIIGRQLTADDHRDLVRQTLAELDETSRN